MKHGRKLNVAAEAAVVAAEAAVVTAADAAAMAEAAVVAAEAVADAAETVETAETAGKKAFRTKATSLSLGTPLETFLRNSLRQVCACPFCFPCNI